MTKTCLQDFLKKVIADPVRDNLYFFIALVLLWGVPDCIDYAGEEIDRFGISLNYSFSPLKLLLAVTQACLIAWSLCKVSRQLHNSLYFKVPVLVLAALMCIADVFCLLQIKMHFIFLVYDLLTQTTAGEAGEFFAAYISRPSTFYTLLIVAAAFALAWICYRGLTWIWCRGVCHRLIRGVLYLSVAVGTVSTCMCLIVPLATAMRIQPIAESLPVKVVIASVKSHLNHPDMQQLAMTHEQVTIDSVGHKPEVVLCVIGESYNRHHCGLYGYLDTTPYMQKEADADRLFVYEDVLACHNLTYNVMMDLFTTRPYMDDDNWDTYPLFPALFRKAGYSTYYFNNQTGKLQAFNMVPYFNDEDVCDENFDYVNPDVYGYDADMLGDIASQTAQSGPCLVVVSLYGQHLPAIERYPDDFTVFSASDYPDSLTETQRCEIAAYDNACLYNDMVNGRLMDMFRDRETVMVYFSDHGEEVHDFRNNYGRITGEINDDIARNVYEVPFVIWCSDKYKAANPDKVEQIASSTGRRYSNADVSHLLLDLGNIACPDFQPSRSIINPAFNGYPARELDHGYVYDR